MLSTHDFRLIYISMFLCIYTDFKRRQVAKLMHFS